MSHQHGFLVGVGREERTVLISFKDVEYDTVVNYDDGNMPPLGSWEDVQDPGDDHQRWGRRQLAARRRRRNHDPADQQRPARARVVALAAAGPPHAAGEGSAKQSVNPQEPGGV